MATQYPEGIDNATTLPKIIDLVTPVDAVSVNLLRDAIVAIETELGIEPSIGYATVRDRLDALTLLVEASGAGVQSIKQDGVSIVAPATSINFTGAVSVTDAGDCEATVEILSSGGTITGASNIGSGADIFSADVANVLQFRGISGIEDISAIVNGDNVEVSGAALLPLDGDRAMTGDLDLGSNNITNVDLINSVDITDHHVRHENGGVDEISVEGLSGELTDPQKVSVRIDSGPVVGSRKRLNFIPSSDISISATDDGSEIDISFDLETSTVSTLMYQEIFSALSGQTDFVLTQTPVGQQYVEMFINGVSQTVGSSYDYVLIGKTVVYIGSVVLEGGEEVVIKYFRKADVDGIVATQMYQESFVATSGQTDFVVSHLPISQEYVEMFIDGLSKTEAVDYTADGYVITYSNLPPLSGGEIIDIKYFTSLYADDIKHEIISLIETGQIDGYNLIVNYIPTNYPETENTFLGEHLSNIDFAIGNHGSNHENGGTDEISVNGLSGVLSDPQNIVAAYNGTSVGTRPILNFIPGANVGITVADNTTGSRADITIAASVTAAPSVAISAGTNSASSGTVSFINSNNVSFGMNTSGGITASVGIDGVVFSAGTNSQNTGTVIFSNSNGISFGMDTAGIVTASYVPLFVSAGTNIRSVGTVSFANSNGVSFGMDTDGIVTASISAAAGDTLAISAGTNSRNSGTVVFNSTANGVSVGMDTDGVITFSTSSNTPAPLWISAGTNSRSSGTIQIASNSQNVSAGMNTDGIVTLSVAPPDGGIYFSAGTNSRSVGTVTFSNSNGISFGMDTGGVVTASTTQASQVPIWISAGANSTSNGTVSFINSNGVSFGMNTSGGITASISAAAGNSLAISAGTNSKNSGTVVFSNSNGVSFGMNTAGAVTASFSNAAASIFSTFGSDMITVGVWSVGTSKSMCGLWFNIYAPVNVSKEVVVFNNFNYGNTLTIRPNKWLSANAYFTDNTTTSGSLTCQINDYVDGYIGFYSSYSGGMSLLSSSLKQLEHVFKYSLYNTASRNGATFTVGHSFSYSSHILLDNSISVRQGSSSVDYSRPIAGTGLSGLSSQGTSTYAFGIASNTYNWMPNVLLSTQLAENKYAVLFLKSTNGSSIVSNISGETYGYTHTALSSIIATFCNMSFYDARPDYLIGSSDSTNVLSLNLTYHRSISSGTGTGLSVFGMVRNNILPINGTSSYTSLPATLTISHSGDWLSTPMCLLY